jgi:hypothetical protein
LSETVEELVPEKEVSVQRSKKQLCLSQYNNR